MNKRQAKKKEKNELLLGCMTYREDRQLMRQVKVYENSQRYIKEITEDMEILVELGLYTWEEVEEKLNAKNKEKRRWRQLNKVK